MPARIDRQLVTGGADPNQHDTAQGPGRGVDYPFFGMKPASRKPRRVCRRGYDPAPVIDSGGDYTIASRMDSEPGPDHPRH